MLSGIEFNKGYTSSYIMLPLNKNGMLTVVSTDKELDAKIKETKKRIAFIEKLVAILV